MVNINQEKTSSNNQSVRLDPVFVIGYKRSGTTMTRLMLNRHPELFIPRESEYFQKVPVHYGKKIHQPEEAKNIITTLPKDTYKSLIDEDYFCQLLQDNLPGRNDILLACLYQSCIPRSKINTIRWGDKKPQHWQFVYGLRQWYPQSQFLHIVRDPRDVVASIENYENKGIELSRKNVFWQYFPTHIIYAWQQNFAFKAMKEQGEILGVQRYLKIKYEELVANPDSNLESICDFLKLDPNFKEEMLKFDEDGKNPKIRDGKPSQALHMEQTTRKINNQSIGRYKESLSKKQIKEIEFICHDLITEMGYSESEYVLSIWEKIRLSAMCQILRIAWDSIRIRRRLKGSL